MVRGISDRKMNRIQKSLSRKYKAKIESNLESILDNDSYISDYVTPTEMNALTTKKTFSDYITSAKNFVKDSSKRIITGIAAATMFFSPMMNVDAVSSNMHQDINPRVSYTSFMPDYSLDSVVFDYEDEAVSSILEKIEDASDYELFQPEGNFKVDINQYDDLIIDIVAKYNRRLFSETPELAINPNVIKAMIVRESGGNPDAFAYDPLQVANYGDYALRTVRNGGEYTYYFVDDEFRDSLRDIDYTRYGHGGWDYSHADEANTPKLLEVGINWYINKCIKSANFETSFNDAGEKVYEMTITDMDPVGGILGYNSRESYMHRVLDTMGLKYGDELPAMEDPFFTKDTLIEKQRVLYEELGSVMQSQREAQIEANRYKLSSPAPNQSNNEPSGYVPPVGLLARAQQYRRRREQGI